VHGILVLHGSDTVTVPVQAGFVGDRWTGREVHVPLSIGLKKFPQLFLK